MVTVDVGAGEVTATAFHPFWVLEGEDLDVRPALRHVDINEDRGQSLPGRWVNSHDLREGDVVFLRNSGPVTLRRVWVHDESTPVCNLTIRGLHTFAVGQSQLLVHNMTGTGEGAEKGKEPQNPDVNKARPKQSKPPKSQAPPQVTKSNSPVWKELKPFRGKTKTNGLSESKRRYYEWDHTHNDIEVYDKGGNHLGSMDPSTGQITKPPV